MKTNTSIKPVIKPVASLSSSLLARKGHAMPAASATIYNNPGLAWTGNTAKNKGANKVGDGKQKDGSVALIINIEEKNYMALKYQAQVSGKTTQELIRTAIHNYIDGQGILRAKDWVISPSN